MNELNIWKSLLATIIYFVALQVFGLLILFYFFLPDTGNLQTTSLIICSLDSLSSLALLLTLFFALKKYIFGQPDDLRKLHLDEQIQFSLISIGLGVIIIAIQPLIRTGFELLPAFQSPKIDPVELRQFEIWDIPVLLSHVIFMPISEELFFRGFLLKGLLKKNSWIKSLLISAILFALLHFAWLTMDMLSFKRVFITFIGGLFAGALYIKTKDIAYPILFHVTWNLIGNLDDFISIPFA